MGVRKCIFKRNVVQSFNLQKAITVANMRFATIPRRINPQLFVRYVIGEDIESSAVACYQFQLYVNNIAFSCYLHHQFLTDAVPDFDIIK